MLFILASEQEKKTEAWTLWFSRKQLKMLRNRRSGQLLSINSCLSTLNAHFQVEVAKGQESESEDEGLSSPGTCVVNGKRYQLVDIPESNSNRGRPPSEFLKLVSQSCVTVGVPKGELKRFRCVEAKCSKTWASQNVQRIQRHVPACKFMSDEFRDRVEELLRNDAPTVRVEKLEQAIEEVTKAAKEGTKKTTQTTLTNIVGQAAVTS
jgi:hypothetical protein